jgi:proline iminopeptidase
MWPWEKEIIETNRGNFEVFISGEGTPICVTHHYTEFNESGDALAQVMRENNKVILVNLREAGNSTKAVEPYQLSLIEAVFDLEEIRKELGYNRWTYVGHSTGGMIGILYGIHFSSSLDSLILVGSAAREYASSSADCIYNEGHPKFQRMQELIELLKLTTLSDEERKKLSKERTQLSLFNPEKYEEYFSSNIIKKMSRKRIDFFAREALIFGVTEQLSKITTKTLIICGRHDVQCPVTFSIEMSKKIHNAFLHIFEQSNHYPFLEEEFEFKRIVKAFLN